MKDEIVINPKLLKARKAVFKKDWRIWEKKSLNIHRGVIEWSVNSNLYSIEGLAKQIREGVRMEFKPGWFRGFAFGTVFHLIDIPKDFANVGKHIDTRNRLGGVWQWTILCFDQYKVGLGIHTWLHGYLRPVYDSVLDQLKGKEFVCESADIEMDKLVVALQSIGRVCHPFSLIIPP